MMLIQHSFNSDWLSNTQSRVRQADWLMLEYNEKATLNINMPYYFPFHKEDNTRLKESNQTQDKSGVEHKNDGLSNGGFSSPMWQLHITTIHVILIILLLV